MSKKTIITIIILIAVAAGFFWYRGHVEKNKVVQRENKSAETAKNVSQSNSSDEDDSLSNSADDSSDESDMVDANFNASCENGEWMKIADLSGETITVSGKLRKVYPDDEVKEEFRIYPYYIEGGEETALTGKDQTKIDNFEDREVEVQGVKAADGKSLEISQIRCAGKETDPGAISQRNSLLDYITKNINSIAPKKATYQKWTVDIVDIVDENNVYVEYYDTVEDDDNSDVDADTSRKLLMKVVPKAGGGYSTNELAYWESEEGDLKLKRGIDKFENAEDIVSFQYDQNNETWDRL
jgi:hypothetical protein